MTKRINGDLYSDLITSADPRQMASGGYPRLNIDRIVIHHNGGMNTAGALTWWSIDSANIGGFQTSAHYQVDNDQIIGAVGEETPAWHAGSANMNQRSIGIEHVNSTLAPNWLISNKTFESSARLIADISKRYNIPIDAKHVIPHSDVFNTSCPGGIDMAKLRKRANEIKNGVKPPMNNKLKLKRTAWLYAADGLTPLHPNDNMRNADYYDVGSEFVKLGEVGRCYKVRSAGRVVFLRKENF